MVSKINIQEFFRPPEIQNSTATNFFVNQETSGILVFVFHGACLLLLVVCLCVLIYKIYFNEEALEENQELLQMSKKIQVLTGQPITIPSKYSPYDSTSVAEPLCLCDTSL